MVDHKCFYIYYSFEKLFVELSVCCCMELEKSGQAAGQKTQTMS